MLRKFRFVKDLPFCNDVYNLVMSNSKNVQTDLSQFNKKNTTHGNITSKDKYKQSKKNIIAFHRDSL
jgi:hypothetical protein